MSMLQIKDSQYLTALKENIKTHTKHSRYLDPNILPFQKLPQNREGP